MKLILAATDFSKASRHAVNYAAEIALRAKAKLVLLNTYHPVVIVADVPVVIPPPADMEKAGRQRLNKIRYRLLAKYGKTLEVALACVEGLAADAIAGYAQACQADLVVVGTHGAGYLEEKLIGSVTSGLIARCKCPVLSVPSRPKFNGIKKIVLASDYRQLSASHVLDPLLELARLFRSHIYVLNVIANDTETPTVSQAVAGIKLDQLLQAHDHTFHVATSNDLVEAINRFSFTQDADLIVMMPRQLGFLKSLFTKSNSKAMAFRTHTPLLTIHH